MAFMKDTPSVMVSWDELRRQARSLENDLDTKLVSLGSIGGVFGRSGSFGAVSMREEFDQNYTKYCREIDDILERLTRVNDQMTELVQRVDEASGSSQTGMPIAGVANHQQVHTAKRHREILRDYVQEFRETKSKVVAARDREDLLGSVYRDLNQNSTGQDASSPIDDGFSASSSSTRLLMDEQDRLHRSSRMVDEQLSAASAVRTALRVQHRVLKSTSAGLHSLSARFPRIKYLVNAIDCRHRQDSLVLGVVIGLCFVFLIIYKFA